METAAIRLQILHIQVGLKETSNAIFVLTSFEATVERSERSLIACHDAGGEVIHQTCHIPRPKLDITNAPTLASSIH